MQSLESILTGTAFTRTAVVALTIHTCGTQYNALAASLQGRRTMLCSTCGFPSLHKFESETSIHFPRLSDMDKPPVVMFEELSVCLKCGKAEFVLPQEKLALLEKSDSASPD